MDNNQWIIYLNATRKSQLSFLRAPLLFCGAPLRTWFFSWRATTQRSTYWILPMMRPLGATWRYWALLGHGGNRRWIMFQTYRRWSNPTAIFHSYMWVYWRLHSYVRLLEVVETLICLAAGHANYLPRFWAPWDAMCMGRYTGQCKSLPYQKHQDIPSGKLM